MESTGTSVAAAAAVAVAGAAPAVTMAPANTSTSDAAPNATTEAATAVENKSFTPEFDPCIPEEERRFYLKAYPSVDLVRERRVHCTVCKAHIGTAPNQEHNIKMHPVLRVTHCIKCHDFYNSGEFSKGEDGSELYCRWCGQGGEVYCCSSCPYVFCKSCIVKNLSKGVVADIEQNENWNCFSCAPKILWPLRALHWALVNFIEKQKISFQSGNYSETDLRVQMAKDRSTCCRLAKAKCGNMSDSLESLDSVASRRSQSSSGSTKKKLPVMQYPNAKRPKTSNDEVVCTPDLLSMLEPDCQITVSSNKSRPSSGPITTSPKVISLQSGYGSQPSTPKNNTPPPLVLRNTGIPMRHHSPMPVVRRTVVGPRTPTPAGSNTPVYHTINGYRIDLNTAAQQETFRLPNGKLIQVKRQGAQQHSNSNSPNNSWQQQLQQRSAISIHQSQQLNRSVQITQNSPQQFVSIPQSPSVISGNHTQQQQHPHIMRYQNAMVGSTSVTPLNQSSGNPQMHVLNGATVAPTAATATVRTPIIVRHVFPDTAIGQARSQLQDQVFNAMEICQHLTGKIQTLTNSNAYKQARNYLEVKELYIHLSYLLTYAIGRFKGLQDKCLGDMRQLGFVNDADSLENGQLAAGVDYVRYGQLDDVDLFNTGSNSFHNQVYEYRKNLHANLESGADGGPKEPLSPLMTLGVNTDDYTDDNDDDNDDKMEGEKDVDNDNDDDDDGNGKSNRSRHQHRHRGASNDDDADGGIEPDGDADADADYDDDGDGDGDDEDLIGWQGNDESEIMKSQFKQEAKENDDNEETMMEEEMDGDEDDGFLGFESSTFSEVGGIHNSSQRNTEEYMSREEEAHSYGRKLTRLVQQYPSIWCTRHPDYGNFEVTRKQWRAIASHFKRSDNIKLRWKNIRKRYVRIERRLLEGKRFNGYYDKASNFLANRDLPESDWIATDCGTEDGDTFERNELDAIEQALHPSSEQQQSKQNSFRYSNQRPIELKPIEIRATDAKIINFVKCNPVLWRQAGDQHCNNVDEHTRKTLWRHLWKSMPNMNCEDIIDRWSHLYEMYKTFRLKTIKDETILGNLELKYSKYLAKLYFLYKIDEEELRNENVQLEDCDDDVEQQQQGVENDTKLRDMSDDKEFVLQLVRAVRKYPVLWNQRHSEYYDVVQRESAWKEIGAGLKEFKRDLTTIKLRWQLAKFSYFRLRRDRRKLSDVTNAVLEYCKNLPTDEMTFLDF